MEKCYIILAASGAVNPANVQNGILANGVIAQNILGGRFTNNAFPVALRILPHLTDNQINAIRPLNMGQYREFLETALNYLSKNQQVQQEIRTFLGIDFQLITKLNKAIQINTILSQIVSPIQGRKIDNLCQCLQSTQVDIAMNQIPQHCAPRNNVNLACPVYAQINSPEDRIQAYTSILQVLQTNPNCLAIVHFANEGDPRKGGHACLVCGHTGNSLTIYNPDPAYAAANPYDIPALSYRAPSGIKKVATEYYIITW